MDLIVCPMITVEDGCRHVKSMTCNNKSILGELEAVSLKDIDIDPSVRFAAARCYRGTAGHAIRRWSIKQLFKSSFISSCDAAERPMLWRKHYCTLAALSLIETLYGSGLLQHPRSRWSDRRTNDLALRTISCLRTGEPREEIQVSPRRIQHKPGQNELIVPKLRKIEPAVRKSFHCHNHPASTRGRQ
ncbi:hypothetical protein BDN71DRAFT_1449163 [Pleurotus eryngii]|uniref:Uncharacterized protein n=1 Tax=Pleurotus eryngii TaxID=5323 RepID=A0A9P6D664_PLEER|nr:hypothetical protein BDN71DRAFT_1449163 [Pleurotus eryngii]